jgi:DNA-directed RNA polymerase sigma subunit (sigma70/sigma32)
MKTLNSRKNKQNSFAGTVDVYDEKIYIDTDSGEGYDKVITKLDKLINFLAVKYRFHGFTFEDGRQHVTMHILEGIPKFDPSKGVKLSTFIQMMVSRRLINELRNESKSSRNATFLNVRSYSCICSCGYNNNITISADDDIGGHCDRCRAHLSGARRVISVNPSEISLDEHLKNMRHPDRGIADADVFTSEMSDRNDFMQTCDEKSTLDENVIMSYDVQKWLATEDPLVVRLIELICIRDYSLKAAADEVGISRAWADVKLKQLKDKHIVKEIFGRS